MYYLNECDIGARTKCLVGRAWGPYEENYNRIKRVVDNLGNSLLSPYEILAAGIWLSNCQSFFSDSSLVLDYEKRKIIPLLRGTWGAFLDSQVPRWGEFRGKIPRFCVQEDRLLKVRSWVLANGEDTNTESMLLCNWGAFLFDPARMVIDSPSAAKLKSKCKQLQCSFTCQVAHFVADINEAALMFEGSKEGAMHWYFAQRKFNPYNSFWDKTEQLAACLMESHRADETGELDR